MKHNADPLSSAKTNRHGPDLTFEMACVESGHGCIAGVDEAGRGPLAGPVVAAAVCFAMPLSREAQTALAALDDSKKLTARKRMALYEAIHKHADSISIASIGAQSIDRVNILQATMMAMRKAIVSLPQIPDAVLVDGNRIPSALPHHIHAQALIGGDGLSLSIAAASVVAKVTRDRMMNGLDGACPEYGFAGHKGYGSAAHQLAITQCGGVDRVHRFTFRPLSQSTLLNEKSPAGDPPG